MLPRTKISFLIVVLVLVCSFSGSCYGTKESALNHIGLHFKVPQQARKLLGGVDFVDYNNPGANQSHDPGKGRPGGQH